MTIGVDFTHKQFAYRLSHLQGTNELIAKAIGFKKNVPLCVCDATAGLGKESFLLAALGCEVRLLERHPQVAQLLRKGLNEALKDPTLTPIVTRMQLIERCAIDYLTQQTDYHPDIIYCDPMFESRSKSAAAKKGMQYLQTLVGHDEDAEQLVKIALKRAKKRVVVKRARLAPSLYKTPSFSLKARSHRFDVYFDLE